MLIVIFLVIFSGCEQSKKAIFYFFGHQNVSHRQINFAYLENEMQA